MAQQTEADRLKGIASAAHARVSQIDKSAKELGRVSGMGASDRAKVQAALIELQAERQTAQSEYEAAYEAAKAAIR